MSLGDVDEFLGYSVEGCLSLNERGRPVEFCHSVTMSLALLQALGHSINCSVKGRGGSPLGTAVAAGG